MALIRPLELSKQINDREALPEARDRVLNRIDSITEQTDCNGVFLTAIQSVVSRTSLFESNEHQTLKSFVERFSRNLRGNPDWSKAILDCLITIAKYVGDTDRVASAHEEYANALIEEALAHEGESPLISADFLGRAIEHVRLSGVEDPQSLIEGLQTRRTELLTSSDSIFTTFSSEIHVDMTVADEQIEQLLADTEAIVLTPSVLLLSVVPNRNALRSAVEKQRETAPLMFMIPHQAIAEEGFVDYEAVTEEELFGYHSVQYVNGALRLASLYVRRLIFRIGDAWTIDRIMTALQEAPLIDPRRLASLKRALRQYFEGEYETAVTLLSIELEPITRGVIQKMGLATVVQSSPKNPKTQRAKTLNEVLRVKEVELLFGEPWILAVQSLLNQDAGLKLRHRIAHGLAVDEQLNQQVADILVCLLLHIANFKERGDIDKPPEPQ